MNPEAIERLAYCILQNKLWLTQEEAEEWKKTPSGQRIMALHEQRERERVAAGLA